MKVRCIEVKPEYENIFKVGNIYEIKNNNITTDQNFTLGGDTIVDVESANKWCGKLVVKAKFEEVIDEFKVKCIGKSEYQSLGFKVGNVYTVKNGLITDDGGMTRPCDKIKTFNSLEDLNDWRIYGIFELYVEPSFELYAEIKITRNGRKLTGKYTFDGKTYIAVAKCNPEDEFDMEIGSKLVIERLMEKANPKPKKLYLEYLTHSDAGEVGVETNLTALFGEKLYVGDLVELYSTYTGERYERTICHINGKFGIMGFFDRSIDMKNGVFNGYQVRKISSYTTLKDGDKLTNAKVILK